VPKYVATFRATYDADNDVQAQIISDQIRLNGERDLDIEDGDELECTQVTSNGLELLPDELMVLLRKTRNALIRTQWRPAYDEARELDRLIYAMKFRDEPAFTMSGYDYGNFMDLCEAIIHGKEEPDVSR
jgi:hypothetical protein